VKIQFDTPLTGTDQNNNPVTLTADQIAALSYMVLLDTVNPPQKSYPVPAANIAAATANANGSKHVTVLDTDLGVTIADNVQYYVEIQDALGTQVSPPTAVLPYEHVVVVTPGPVQNPTVA
jgi:hypothetical protein